MRPRRRTLHAYVIVLMIVILSHLALALAPTPAVTPQKAIVVSFKDTPARESNSPLGGATEDETATTTAATPAPAMTPASKPTTSPGLTNDMRNILRKVGSVPCDETTRSRMFAILYDSNVLLHDTCIADTGYQFFPYPGELPTVKQIVATVKSTACMQLHAGVILANFPECDIDFVSVRSSAEVYYRIKKDIDADRVPPTQAQFYEFYNLNRVVNLLNENASLIEAVFRESPVTAAVSLSEMTRLMNPIVLLPGVTLGADMTITIVAEAPAQAASSSSSSTVDDASENGNSTALDSKPPSTPTPIPNRLTPTLANTTNQSSSARPATRTACGAWARVAVGAVAIAMAVIASTP